MSMFLDEFDQAPGLCYLNHAAIAPWPRRASEAVARFARDNVHLGAREYPAWLATERRLRERLARLLNAPTTGDIALVGNTSQALSLVAFGLDWQPGDQVIISDEEFPSNRVVWQALAERGVEVLEVSLAGEDPEAALLNACGPQARLLAISAVQFGSGLRLDLARLGEDAAAVACCSAWTLSSKSVPCPSMCSATSATSPWPTATSGCSAPRAWQCSTAEENCASSSS